MAAENKLRKQLLQVSNKLIALGLNSGTTGNCSVRLNCAENFLITPSGLTVEEMTPEAMVIMDASGAIQGTAKPSSEWRFHRDILGHRPEVNAVVHVHSPFATSLACLHRDLPPFHYMIAAAGGESIRCAPYALFGSQLLSDLALQALENRTACLLGNHGMIALGKDLESALRLTVQVESLCQQYCQALQVGEPILLSHQQMAEVIEKFKEYGHQAITQAGVK